MLQVKNISKSYNSENIAVCNVSFAMLKGEKIAILGETGSGKTTLLKLLAGLIDSDSGEIYFNKTKVFKGDKLIAGEKGIEVVFQDFELFPNYTIEENIEHKIRYFSKQEREKITSDLIDSLRLTQFKNRFPKEISGGQKQKVAIARALANKPSLLLMDEPYSNLDFITKSELKSDLKLVLKKNKASAIMVTHSAEDAFSFADRVFVMRNGTIIQTGTPEEIYLKPVSEYVANFVGECTILSGKKWKELAEDESISSTKKYLLRPENVQIANNGIVATVLECEFKGFYYKLVVKTISGSKLILFHNHSLDIGFKIKIVFSVDKFVEIKSK